MSAWRLNPVRKTASFKVRVKTSMGKADMVPWRVIGKTNLDIQKTRKAIQNAYYSLEDITRKSVETDLAVSNADSHNPLTEHKRS
jgi:ATP-dependent Lon protease